MSRWLSGARILVQGVFCVVVVAAVQSCSAHRDGTALLFGVGAASIAFVGVRVLGGNLSR